MYGIGQIELIKLAETKIMVKKNHSFDSALVVYGILTSHVGSLVSVDSTCAPITVDMTGINGCSSSSTAWDCIALYWKWTFYKDKGLFTRNFTNI